MMIRIYSIALVLLCLVNFAVAQVGEDTTSYDYKKAHGYFSTPVQPVYGGNYPTLINRQAPAQQGAASRTARSLVIIPERTLCGSAIPDPSGDPTFSHLPPDDDSQSVQVSLPFTFNLFGDNYQTAFIGTNGNITFNTQYTSYTAQGFPLQGVSMAAPFWADVDTRGDNSGLVYYRVESHRLIVIWYRVGYYPAQDDKVNTFELVITDGTDPYIGLGNNVGFLYGDMQWTTGGANGGVGGLGGTPANVGLNKGVGTNNCFFFQIGQFNKSGTEFISPRDPSGIDYLDNKCYTFDASTITDVTANITYERYYCSTILPRMW